MKESSKGPTLAESCYTHIKDAIIQGKFLPGEKLRLTKLTSYCNAGPTPVREALSRLASSDLVEMKPNKGFAVKKVSQEEVRDIYETFYQIEQLALDKAIDLGNTNWEASILGALHELSAVEKHSISFNIDHWLRLNHAFHSALIGACHSPCLLKIREDMYQLFDRYCRLSLSINQDNLLSNNQDHCEIAKAVIERNKHKAFHLTNLHLEKSFNQAIQALQNF